MATTLDEPATDGVEFPNAATCRIYSRRPVKRWSGEQCALATLGELRFDARPGDLEGLATAYLASKDPADFYDRLTGQFCLVIADHRDGSLQLLSDFMGIQSCYYTVEDGCLLISDSLDLLRTNAQNPFTISEQALFNYFYFHCIPSPTTIYSQCLKLEPGKALRFNNGKLLRESSLYRPDFASACKDETALQRRCLDEIEGAVAQYAAPATGAFLSGGLDSSSVAGMLARHQDPARTFSIGFESPDYDETPFAKITANHFNTEHEVYYLKAEAAAQELVRVAQYFEEPFGNSSAMAAYFCARFAKDRGIDTLLAGDGGDELFAGNGHYSKQKQFELFYQFPGWLRGGLRGLLTNGVSSELPLLRKGASYIRQADVPLPDRLGTYNFVQLYGADQMFSPDFLSRVDAGAPIEAQRSRYFDCSSDNYIDRMLYLDWKFTLADNDLVKVKKMCEMAGVDVRFPLLDRRVVDFSCEVPASAKIPGFKLRDFYKNACRGFLADETLSKSKHGFGLPFGLWMKDNTALKNLSRDCIESFRQRGILADTLIDDALKSHETVHAGYYGELIWIIVILELWLQREST